MGKFFKNQFNISKKKQKGYTLLEYCAGAAIIAGIVFTALNTLGGSFNTYLNELSDWVGARTGEVSANSGSANGGN